MGIIRGATTNPTIMFKDGVTGGIEGVKARSIEIANLIAPYPVSIEVMTNEPKRMKEQAIEFSQWADNIVIKITIHGPNGELDNIALVNELENSHNVRVNVTAMMSAQQCLLAAMAGATYVSLFEGRVNNMGYDSRLELQKARKVLDGLGLKLQDNYRFYSRNFEYHRVVQGGLTHCHCNTHPTQGHVGSSIFKGNRSDVPFRCQQDSESALRQTPELE